MDKSNNLQPVLYITYLGLLEPIPQAQVIPYLVYLSKDARILLLSFEKPDFLRERPDELVKVTKLLESANIKWFKLRYHKRPKILSSIYDIFLGFIFCLYLIKCYKIKIVHARSNIPIAIGFLLKIIMNKKLIYDRRGVMGEDHVEHSKWKKGELLYKLSIWFEKKAIYKADAIIVLTDWMNNYLRENILFHPKTIIETIPCCVDLNLFRYNNNYDKKGLLKDKFVFAYVGSLGTYNLLEEMLDFFKVALKYISQATFLIFTHTPELISIICKKKGIDPNLLMVRFASRDKLPNLLSAVDAGIIFRRPTLTARASSPTKFAEYLACGLPVICGPGIGDLDNIVIQRNIGIVLEDYNIKVYEQAIQKLLLMKKEYSLKERCRKAAEDLFSLEKGASKYLMIYKKLI